MVGIKMKQYVNTNSSRQECSKNYHSKKRKKNIFESIENTIFLKSKSCDETKRIIDLLNKNAGTEQDNISVQILQTLKDKKSSSSSLIFVQLKPFLNR